MLYLTVTLTWSCDGSSCFKYFQRQLMWRDAKMKCEELGGELPRITTLSVNQFVGGIIQSNIWIGLNDNAEPGNYKRVKESIGTMRKYT